MDSDSLRIAQVPPLWAAIPPQRYGGIESLMASLIEHLAQRGHQVTLFGTGDCRTSAELRPVLDVNITELMMRDQANVAEYYMNAAVAEALRSAGDFDLIHFHLGCAWIPLFDVAATRTLLTLHTYLDQDDRWSIERYPKVPLAAISRAQVAAVRAEIPVVYNACDFGAYPLETAPGEHLAFLGRMSPEKNPVDAIILARRVGLPIAVAGEPQSAKEKAYFEAKVKPLLREPGVEYLGGVNHAQKCALLQKARAFVFPIAWPEPFGLVMIEAMASGTPVLAYAQGSVPEVVEPGRTGYFGANVDELEKLLPSTLALDRAGVRAAAQIRFDMPRMVDDYLRLYRSILARPR